MLRPPQAPASIGAMARSGRCGRRTLPEGEMPLLALLLAALLTLCSARVVVFERGVGERARAYEERSYLVLDQQDGDVETLMTVELWTGDEEQHAATPRSMAAALSGLLAPVSWVYEQLEAIDAMQRAAVDTFVLRQYEASMHEATLLHADEDGGAEDEEEMGEMHTHELLQRLGCQRVGTAMDEYMQARGVWGAGVALRGIAQQEAASMAAFDAALELDSAAEEIEAADHDRGAPSSSLVSTIITAFAASSSSDGDEVPHTAAHEADDDALELDWRARWAGHVDMDDVEAARDAADREREREEAQAHDSLAVDPEDATLVIVSSAADEDGDYASAWDAMPEPQAHTSQKAAPHLEQGSAEEADAVAVREALDAAEDYRLDGAQLLREWSEQQQGSGADEDEGDGRVTVFAVGDGLELTFVRPLLRGGKAAAGGGRAGGAGRPAKAQQQQAAAAQKQQQQQQQQAKALVHHYHLNDVDSDDPYQPFVDLLGESEQYINKQRHKGDLVAAGGAAAAAAVAASAAVKGARATGFGKGSQQQEAQAQEQEHYHSFDAFEAEASDMYGWDKLLLSEWPEAGGAEAGTRGAAAAGPPLLLLLGLAACAMAVASVASWMQLQAAMHRASGCGADGGRHVTMPVMVRYNGRMVRGVVVLSAEDMAAEGLLAADSTGQGKDRGSSKGWGNEAVSVAVPSEVAEKELTNKL